MNNGLLLKAKKMELSQRGAMLRGSTPFKYIPYVPPAPEYGDFPTATDYMTNYTTASIAGDYQSGVFAANFAASGGDVYAYGNHPYAWKAFADTDDINTLAYQNSGGSIHNAVNVYLAQKFPEQRVYKSVEIYVMQDVTYYYHPRTFDIRGSNNGTSWDTISSVNRGTTRWDTHNKTFTFSGNESAYQYYGVYCTACGYTAKAGGSATNVDEVYLHRIIWKTA